MTNPANDDNEDELTTFITNYMDTLDNALIDNESDISSITKMQHELAHTVRKILSILINFENIFNANFTKLKNTLNNIYSTIRTNKLKTQINENDIEILNKKIDELTKKNEQLEEKVTRLLTTLGFDN